MTIRIREATASDIDGITRVHVGSWKSTYKGLIADEFLDAITLEARRKIWVRNFETPQKDEVMYVAEGEAGTILGFGNGGARRVVAVEQDLQPHHKPELFDAELYALYLLKDHQGSGLGKQLIRSVAQHLMEKNYTSFMAWVLKGNPAIHFYHRMGGHSVATKKVKIGNELLEEILMGWSEIGLVGDRHDI